MQEVFGYSIAFLFGSIILGYSAVGFNVADSRAADA